MAVVGSQHTCAPSRTEHSSAEYLQASVGMQWFSGWMCWTGPHTRTCSPVLSTQQVPLRFWPLLTCSSFLSRPVQSCQCCWCFCSCTLPLFLHSHVPNLRACRRLTAAAVFYLTFSTQSCVFLCSCPEMMLPSFILFPSHEAVTLWDSVLHGLLLSWRPGVIPFAFIRNDTFLIQPHHFDFWVTAIVVAGFLKEHVTLVTTHLPSIARATAEFRSTVAIATTALMLPQHQYLWV